MVLPLADVENVLSLEEIMSKYAKEWVAVKVVERDSAGQPLKAEVLSHSVDRNQLRDNVADGKEVCIFYAGPIPWEGYVVIF